MARLPPNERPQPSSFAEILDELYQGEVGGEAFFGTLLSHYSESTQRYKLACLLQLETEFKARLRPIAMQHGVDIVESDSARSENREQAGAFAGRSWEQFVEVFAAVIPSFVARFEVLGAAVPEEYAQLGADIVEHETSIGEFAALEAAGEAHRSIERVVRQLRHPIPKPG